MGTERERPTKNLTVVAAVFGESHLPYLWTMLESLRLQSYKKTSVLVAHSGLSPEAQRRLVLQCFDLSFDHIPIIEQQRSVRASGKIQGWHEALGVIKNGTPVVFLDADTFVVKPLTDAFKEPFDIGTTWRTEGRWFLNSGVLFARTSDVVRDWMSSWKTLTHQIIEDKEAHQIALHDFGAADQKALALTLENTNLCQTQLPAEIWNETTISDHPERVAVWHMKGALQAIRIGKKDHRADQDSYKLWRETMERMNPKEARHDSVQ